jgi:hypothetical protein
MSTIIRELTDIQGVAVSAPTENPFTASGLEVFATDAAYEVVRPSPGAGEFYFNSTFGAVRIYNGTDWQFDKTTFSAQTDSTSTGANQDITPNTFDQIIRFTGGSLTSIRSLVPTNQRVVYLFNGQASNGITLVNESAGATAANRILTGSNADYVIQTNQLVKLVYDEDASRWRLLGKPLTGIESFASDAEYTTAHNPPVAGSRYWNTTSLVVREYNGGAWQNNKVLFSTENNTALTGADQNVVPVTDQIIKLSNASLTSVAGINPSVHKFLVLINGTGASLSIKNESSSATSALYRILTGTGVDLSMRDGSSILLAYDDNSSRWRVTGGSGSGGSSTSATNCCQSPNDVSVQWSAALEYGWYSSASTAATTTTTAAECPLAPILNTAIKITRTTASSYDEYRWKMPAALKGNTIPISWLQIAESAMSSGEFKVDVYTYTDITYTDGTKTRKNLRSDSSSVTSIPAYTGFFGSNNAISFDTGSEDYYGMRITRVSGTKYLSIAGIKIGFGDIGVVGAQGEYESTSSYTIGAITTPPTPGTGAIYYRNTYRIGRWAIIRYEFRQTVAGSAGSGDYLLPLPTGLAIDYTRAGNLSTSSANGSVGSGYLTAASSNYEAVPCISSSGSYANKIHLFISNEVTASSPWSGVIATLANSPVQMSVTARVPIVGWDDAIVVGPSNSVEYASTSGTWDAASSTTVYGAAGSQMGGALSSDRVKTVTWANPIQIDDVIIVQGSTDRQTWFPLNGGQIGAGAIPVVPSVDSTGGGFTTGVLYKHLSATQTAINFGRYAFAANDDAPTGAWPSDAYWRVAKFKAGVMVGIEQASSNFRGMVAPRKGQTALTLTSSTPTLSLTRAVGIYYQDQDGAHRLKFNLSGTCAGVARTQLQVQIDGVTFKNTANFSQAISAYNNAVAAIGAYTVPGSGFINYDHTSGSTTVYSLSGDVELDSKPSWA